LVVFFFALLSEEHSGDREPLDEAERLTSTSLVVIRCARMSVIGECSERMRGGWLLECGEVSDRELKTIFAVVLLQCSPNLVTCPVLFFFPHCS
jgi:hypothetical protein